jgi:arginyl-tRNA synthetase
VNILTELKDRFLKALIPLVDDPAELLEMIRPAQDAKFGDYQANCAMPLGKQLGRSPRDIAQQICDALKVDDLCEAPEIAGPGFINLRLRVDWMMAKLQLARADQRLAVDTVAEPKTYVVDFSSPNVAKPMHVGHIRSTVIGDALCRILRFAGHKVISDNHLGDWGTQFGMIIYGFRHFGDPSAYANQPVAELGRVYREVRKLLDYHEGLEKLPVMEKTLVERRLAVAQLQQEEPLADKAERKKFNKQLRRAEGQLRESETELAERQSKISLLEAEPELSLLAKKHSDIGTTVLQETVKLHEGDAENLALWEEFLPACRQEIQRIYDRLDISFDKELGESFYHPRLPGVVESFQKAGLAEVSEDAMCVFLDGYDAPMIIQKRDGAYLYATTDLATIQYRRQEWKPDAILYVVDFRQGEHFEKLFAAARKWGHTEVDLRHVSFGTVLGGDGKPFKTRSGDTVGLESLLDEAEKRALAVIIENDESKPESVRLDHSERQGVAKVVGIAALKYADLTQNRTSDYVFSYDKMLALNGNTATYMQYSYARVHGIFARGGVDVDALRGSTATIALGADAERALGLQLLRFGDAIDESLADYRPNQLTSYLFDLAKTFSTFFENCPVLKAESETVRDSRLLLCDLTARTLGKGLELLGIQVIQKM